MGDVRATYLDGPWDADGTERWVESPPPLVVETPDGTTYRLVDAGDNMAIYQDSSAEG